RSRPSSPDTDALGRAPPRDPVPASSRRLMAVPEPSAASSAACWSSRLRYACPCCQVVPGGCSPEPESSRSGHIADTEQIIDFGESAIPIIAGRHQSPVLFADEIASPPVRRAVSEYARHSRDVQPCGRQWQCGIDGERPPSLKLVVRVFERG